MLHCSMMHCGWRRQLALWVLFNLSQRTRTSSVFYHLCIRWRWVFDHLLPFIYTGGGYCVIYHHLCMLKAGSVSSVTIYVCWRWSLGPLSPLAYVKGRFWVLCHHPTGMEVATVQSVTIYICWRWVPSHLSPFTYDGGVGFMVIRHHLRLSEEGTESSVKSVSTVSSVTIPVR